MNLPSTSCLIVLSTTFLRLREPSLLSLSLSCKPLFLVSPFPVEFRFKSVSLLSFFAASHLNLSFYIQLLFQVVQIDFSLAVRADRLVRTPFNRPLIASADFFLGVEAAFTAELVTSLSTSFVGLQSSDVSITIVRQLEVVTLQRESAFMVDCVVSVNGQLLFPTVFPQIDFDAVLAAFPPTPPEGPAFAILDIDISQTISLSACFSLTLDLYDVDESTLTLILSAYETSLQATSGEV